MNFPSNNCSLLLLQETFISTPMELGVDVQARIKHLQGQRDKKKAKNRVLEKVERHCEQMVERHRKQMEEAGRVDDVQDLKDLEDLKEDLDIVKVTWQELDSKIDAIEEGLKGALPKLAQFKSESRLLRS